MDQVQKDFIGVLSAALNSQIYCAEEINFSAIFSLAREHSVANMLYHALANIQTSVQPTETERHAMKELAYSASVRDVIQSQEWLELSERFSAQKIFVLPLKGCIIKDAYPKQGIRYMSDTDLLIQTQQAEKVKDILTDLGYRTISFGRGVTDTYLSPMGMNYEVHRSAYTAEYVKKSTSFLKNLFSYAVPTAENSTVFQLPNEEHYAYILCHFIKHLVNGGVGVRQVMDVYVCRKYWSFDEKKLQKLLAQLGLSEFAAVLERLANHWFANEEADAVSIELGDYVLGSGTFGNEEQFVVDSMLKQKHSKSKLGYMLCRAFPPFKTMRFYFPILKKWPILLPLLWIWRIIRALFCKREQLSAEMETVGKTDNAQLQQRVAFYERCGLNIYKM